MESILVKAFHFERIKTASAMHAEQCISPRKTDIAPLLPACD